MTEILASGAIRTYSAKQAEDAFVLLAAIRERGSSSPAFLHNWIVVNKSPLRTLVADTLAQHGYSTDCRLCAAQVDGRRYSLSTLRRKFGVNARRFEAAQHRRAHMKRRRPYGTKDGRPDGRAAPWEPPPPPQKAQGERLLGGEERE